MSAVTPSSLFYLTLLLARFYGSESISWRRLDTSDQFRRRWFAGVDYYNNQLFLFGGEGTSTTTLRSSFGDAWRLPMPVSQSNHTLQWEPIQLPNGPTPRFGVISGIVDNFWIITHGCDNTTCFPDTWAMNLDTTSEWILLINGSTSDRPVPRGRFTGAGGIYPGTSHLWLSMGETTAGRKLSDTWVLDVNVTGNAVAATWREVSPGGGLNQYHPYLPHARFLHSGVPVNSSTFVIFGGCASGGQVGGPCPLQDSWTLDLESGMWTQLATCAPPTVRQSMIAIPNRPGSAYLIGGDYMYTPGVFTQQIMPPSYNNSVMYTLETASDGTASWKGVAVNGAFPARREGASMTIGNGVVYMVAGRTINDSFFQIDVWQLNEMGGSNSSVPCTSSEFTYLHLHGLFMYIAWGLFLPLGVLMGRYYRWTWPIWFIVHVISQSLGVLLTVAGFVVVFLVGSYSSPNFPHAIVGIILTFLLVQQFLSGIYHPCVDKENGKTSKSEKSKYRRCWEVYHAVSGFISIVIGFAQVMLGVLLIGAPVLIWSIWAGLGGLWILIILVHECIYLTYKLSRSKKKV